MRIQKALTDKGKAFTDRLFASRARQSSGERTRSGLIGWRASRW